MESANNGYKTREKYLAYQKSYNDNRAEKEKNRSKERTAKKRKERGLDIPIPCKICSKFFVRNKYALNQIYCGKECSRIAFTDAYKKMRDEIRAGLRPAELPNATEIKNQHNKLISCSICSKEFITNTANQAVCSAQCRKERNKINERKQRAKELGIKYTPYKQCVICDENIPKDSPWNAKTCGDICSRRLKLKSTYDRLNGNWERYLRTLCRKRQETFRCKHFNEHDLIAILEKQNYRCAISGVELTCNVRLNEDPNKKRAVFRANVSIDRIDNSKGYTLDNVHLVCYAVNVARQDCTIEEYIDWCKKVAGYNK